VDDVRDGRGSGRENLGGVNRCAGVRRRKPHTEQSGRRYNTERHTKRAIDQLSDETEGQKRKQINAHVRRETV
jgi:hypothetical protein